MIELPESNTLSRQIEDTLKGKRIKNAVAAQSPHGFAWYSATPEEYRETLSGKTIAGARAVAGYVEIMLSDGWLLDFNDGVNIRYVEDASKLPKKHQLLLEFDGGGFLVCTVQMYGGMMLFRDGANESSYYLTAKEKPTPLTDLFDESYFSGIIERAKPTCSAKALLATEQRIPGLGNGVLQDILWNAGINPQTKIQALSREDRKRLFDSVKQTLLAMTEQGGRDTEKDLFGASGGYHSILSSKTVAYPCPRCGGGITRKAYLGGNVYFCETCQPVLSNH